VHAGVPAGDGERLGGQLVRLSASVGLDRREGGGGVGTGTTVVWCEDIGGLIRIWKSWDKDFLKCEKEEERRRRAVQGMRRRWRSGVVGGREGIEPLGLVQAHLWKCIAQIQTKIF
jgi:hypothetical protein